MRTKIEGLLGAILLTAFSSFITYMVVSSVNKPVEEASVSARHIVLLLGFIAVVATITLLWVVFE